ncbi:MAG: hypothetical protein AB8B74_06695 [Crocinitomicaceae bacterium]
MSNIIQKYSVLILCIIGSFVRLLYGYFFEPWNQAPDHLAWELIIEQGSFRYDHLIHYPHEGGTFLISLLCQIIELFTNVSSLTISAFLIDFTVRFVQIIIVKRVFDMKIAILFGLWTILATPSIIPWGTVNFGLHAIASLFPFLLLLLLSQKKDSLQHHFYCGIFLGVAIWFSYANMILIPVYFLYRLINPQAIKKWVFSIIGLISILILHLLVRQFLDPGFHLNELGIASIRGVDFSFGDIDLIGRLWNIPKVIANAIIALPGSDGLMPKFRLIYYFFFVLASISIIVHLKVNNLRQKITPILSIIVFFFLIYIISPFFDTRDQGNYVIFRHLTYIIPMFSLFIIIGLSSLKYNIIVVAFLAIGMIRSGQLFTAEKLQVSSDITKATGWIIGTKLGHDKNGIVNILNDNPKKRSLLIQGVGWGISASLLFDNDILDKVKTNSKITRLVKLISEYPISFQSDLFNGVKFSFNPELSPKLNPELLLKIEDSVSINE